MLIAIMTTMVMAVIMTLAIMKYSDDGDNNDYKNDYNDIAIIIAIVIRVLVVVVVVEIMTIIKR